MALDQNLFTLNIQNTESGVLLTEPSGRLCYEKRRNAGSEYSWSLIDPLSDATLLTVTAPTASSKTKKLELHNPPRVVEVKYTGTISFKWGFTWETHDFEWRREECFMIRRPDPPVLIAVTKEPPGRIKTSSVQMLDYNLNRFDIDDKRGLEMVILSALLTFNDTSSDYHDSPRPSRQTSESQPLSSAAPPPPPPPPKPKGAANEIIISEDGDTSDFVYSSVELLKDDKMLLVILKSATPGAVPKVMKVIDGVLRALHRIDSFPIDDLKQYWSYDDPEPLSPTKSSRRVIKLDEEPKAKQKDTPAGYRPPENLTVHLSKIFLPDLAPKLKPNPSPGKKGKDKGKGKGKGKEDGGKFKRDQEDKKADTKKSPKHDKQDSSHGSRPRSGSPPGKLSKPSASPNRQSHPPSSPSLYPYQFSPYAGAGPNSFLAPQPAFTPPPPPPPPPPTNVGRFTVVTGAPEVVNNLLDTGTSCYFDHLESHRRDLSKLRPE